MNKKQWVCHISGQGEKWEVTDNGEKETYWQICTPKVCAIFFHLPKSEYRLCEPPEVWRDVTEGARVGSDLSCILYDDLGREISVHNGYRLRKVNIAVGSPREGVSQWAFIVEQKVTQ